MKYKRLLSALTSLVMAASMSAGCLNAFAKDDVPVENYAEPELGDVNGDYMLNIADVVCLNNYLLGKEDNILFDNADMNRDGNINFFDLILLRRRFVDKAPLAQLYPVENLCAGIKAADVEGISADKELALAQTGFGLDMLKNMNCEENTLISPYSVMEALAMTANGAKGDTLKEMEDAMGGISIEKLNKYLYAQRMDQPNEEKCKLLTANSIWARNDESRIKVNKDFLQTDMDYYDAEFYVADFDSPKTVDAINAWVSKHTDKMIDKITNRLSEDAVMELINAVTFDAKWQSPYTQYDVVHGWKFTAADGTEQEADMLCSDEYTYLKDDNAKGVMKYYEGGRYAFAALLPDEGVSLNDYIAGLDAEKLNSILSDAEHTNVITRIPKFTYGYDVFLHEEVLPAMGMVLPFTDFADFSAMNDVKENPLKIGSVHHKTFIQLDGDGTRAAAVTEVSMIECTAVMPDKEVILNRPFLYFIVDTESNIPVFMGTLTSVE